MTSGSQLHLMPATITICPSPQDFALSDILCYAYEEVMGRRNSKILPLGPAVTLKRDARHNVLTVNGPQELLESR